MDEALTRFLSDLVARIQGPMWFRLVLQPLVAVVFGVRAGLNNARQVAGGDGRPGALGHEARRRLLRQAWKDLGMVVSVGVVLDVAVQLLVLGAVYPGETVLVVLCIIVLPYQIIRTIVSRLARPAATRQAD